MKFARDGLPTIAFLVLVTAAFAFISPVPAVILGALTVLVMWFYRDPDRATPEDIRAFFSPADGRVVEIAETEHPFTGPALKVGIFMNLFSVHVNRAPCMGRVDYLEYIPGKKVAAFAPKASEVNERHLVGLSTAYGPVLMTQIAGLVARRIVCRLQRGDVLEAGQRYGMIRLGSRVDIYLPRDVRLTVNIGEKVYAGVSRLGVMDR
ncbi:MAG: phosphatidylserine decarboxylase family protein [Synergistaceae bacterium]|nr:phosphatidylserine decarboxylase family protein [Synergistaceae bacterium]